MTNTIPPDERAAQIIIKAMEQAASKEFPPSIRDGLLNNIARVIREEYAKEETSD